MASASSQTAAEADRTSSALNDDASSNSSSSSDTNAPLDLTADQEWQDVEPDEEALQFTSFFDDATFGNVKDLLSFTAEKHGLDVVDVARRFELDFFGCIKLVNWIRTQAKAQHHVQDLSSQDQFEDDKYLQPVLQDDAVLFSIDEILEMAGRQDVDSAADGQDQAQTKITQNGTEQTSRIAELEAELVALRSRFSQYRSAVEHTLEQRWQDRESSSSQGKEPAALGDSQQRVVPRKHNDAYYFDSYAYNSIHETMLKDHIRTSTYRDFIYSQKHLFSSATVLDVGCGTGILSMFAARAGAKKVFAVDNSDIIVKAREIVAQNGLQDVVACVRGRVEEVELPFGTSTNTDIVQSNNGTNDGQDGKDAKQVDILISEWMGYTLLYESMLDSVINARDRFLSPSGLMVPSHCTLHIAPLASLDSDDSFNSGAGFWRDVYGFDMSPMVDASFYEDVIVRSPPKDVYAAPSSCFRILDLKNVKQEELSWEASDSQAGFEVVLDRNIEGLDAWTIHFDTFFLPDAKQKLPTGARAEEWPKDDDTRGVAFTTGPGGVETHWYTGVLLIDHENKHNAAINGDKQSEGGKSDKPKHRGKAVALPKGTKIKGCVGYKKRESNDRELEIEVRWEAVGTEEKGRQVWLMR